MKLVGLSGTNGSGKDTVGHLLEANHGYRFVSGSDILRKECQRRGLTADRANLRQVGDELRQRLGNGALIDVVVKEHLQSADAERGLVIASIRNPGEAERIHELGGQIVWVDADPRLRYQRIKQRQDRPDEDNKTFKQFLAEEEVELRGYSIDPASLNMEAVKDSLDHQLINNFTSFDQLEAAVGQLAAKLDAHG